MSKIVETLFSNQQASVKLGEKDLFTRITGRFYTHEIIGKQLACALIRVIKSKNIPALRIVDPFCGDGRLVCWLLEEMIASGISINNTVEIDLWDCDEIAVHCAEASVTQASLNFNLPVNINTRVWDTFENALTYKNQFNIVITNPPWEVIKPDSRELQKLTEKEVKLYRIWLKQKDEQLAKLYPLSQPKRKHSGWGTNLARCGTEVALCLTNIQGVCGLVSPVSFLADQMTENLRRWVLKEHIVHELAYYPAEARLFDKVDQSSITLVISQGQEEHFSPQLLIYNRERKVQTKTSVLLSWAEMEANDLTLPIHFGESQIQLLNKFRNLQTFGDLESSESMALWAGRELDETGCKQYLSNDGNFLFLKGRMIQRFRVVEEPHQFVKHNGPKIPQPTDYHRIAWRDVSRPSQKRRLHATIIPSGWVTGNSLHVAYFRDSNLGRLKALLAIMNSLVFEFQLRTYLATSHVSLSSVRKVRLPSLDNHQPVARLAYLVDRCLEGCEESQIEVEIQVAKAYNFNLNEFKLLLSAFDKLTDIEVNTLVSLFK